MVMVMKIANIFEDLCMPNIINSFIYIISFFPHFYEISIIILFLQIRKLEHREVK